MPARKPPPTEPTSLAWRPATAAEQGDMLPATSSRSPHQANGGSSLKSLALSAADEAAGRRWEGGNVAARCYAVAHTFG
jgi:hypothetical protein